MTDTSSLNHLIERLEKATGPDRELDELIMSAIFRREDRHIGCQEEQDDGSWRPVKDSVWVDPATDQWVGTGAREFTSSIDAAMTLVPDRMEKDFTDLYGVARAAVGINANPGPFYGEHEGGSLAIALCIAALKARTRTTTEQAPS